MTNIYLIHAWCLRPFIAYLDPVLAATPEEAIAIARQHTVRLIDSAEECNGHYPWDEFAAYDGDGKELLHVLDAEARLREAIPLMRDTLLYVAHELSAFKPDWLRNVGLDVALEQVEKALAITDSASASAALVADSKDQN